MSILSKVATVGQRRGWMQKAVAIAAWGVGGWAALKLPNALPPGIGLLVIAGIVSVGIVALTRYNPAETAGPAKGKVQLVALAVAGGVMWTVLTSVAALGRGLDPASRPLLVLLTVVAVTGIATTAWSRLKQTHPTALPVTIGDAIDAVTDASRVRAALIAITLTAGVASLAYAGITLAPIAVVIAALIPVGLGWKAARARGRTRAEFSAAFVGLIPASGVGAWTSALEGANRSPIACRWDDDRSAPTRITMPLPPGWRATGVEALEAEVAARLVEHGNYVIRVDLGSKRRVTATLVPPMPTSVRYDGRAADQGTRVWLGVGQAGRDHAVAPGSLGKANGELFDVYWDLRTEPMGMLVGATGQGKTVTVSSVMLQLALAGWRLILLDPKRVEFSAWEDRPGILKVATTLPDMVDSLVNARAEMERRYDEMHDFGVNHIDLMPADARPPRLLIVIDEVVELLTKTPGKSDEAKENNEFKDSAGEAIGSILQLGRAAGVHVIVAGQRVERALFSGTWQNNIALKVLHGRADQVERTMIGLTEVVAAPGIPGRAVMRSLALPQTEVQIAYVDLQKDLDRWLPVGGADVVAPVVDVRPEDLVPPVPVNVVHAPAPAVPVGTTPVTDRDKVARPDVTSPTVTFADVGGYDDVKALLRGAVGTLINNPGAAAQYGLTPSGVLLYGPPGTGKTLLAEATAGELGLQFCKVTTGNLTSQWINAGPELVIAMAETVIAAAPCLLFIDELDGVAPRRDGAHHEDSKVVTELLRQLDRLREVPGVVVMAATNRIQALDPAAIRPGRMDTRIRVDLPDAAAREAILKASLSGRPLEPVMDLAQVVEATVGESGATLAAVVNTAALVALEAGRLIAVQDLLDAIKTRGGKDRPTVEADGLGKLVLDTKTRTAITRLLSLIKDPAQATVLGIKPPTGAILSGPPGTGKTSLGRAIAAEAGCSFYAVTGSEFVKKYPGDAQEAIVQLFERAKANKPSIIFIDEIDSIAGKRDNMTEDWAKATLNTLLTELDGFAGQAGVFTIGATNRAHVLDPGLTRVGRLSHNIEVGLPDQGGREALMALFTMTMPVGSDVDLIAIATLLEGSSPANIRGVVEGAAHAAMDRVEATGTPVTTVTAADFATSLKILPCEVTRTASTSAPEPDGPQGVVDADVIEGEIVDDVGDAAVDADMDWVNDFVAEMIAKETDVPA